LTLRWTQSGAVAVFMAAILCHTGAMGKFPLLVILALSGVLGPPLPTAWAADESPSTSVPTAKPLSPAASRALELDRLFGLLHRADSADAAPAVEQKIWATWASNDSPSAEVLLAQASRAMNAEQLPVAEEILDRLVEVEPGFAEAWNRRATLNFMARRYTQSLADIDKVLELEPRHFGALAGRGMIYEAEGKADKALDAYHEALSINPHMPAVQEG
jgi:tetratricopeptide (TPR) repeat protein